MRRPGLYRALVLLFGTLTAWGGAAAGPPHQPSSAQQSVSSPRKASPQQSTTEPAVWIKHDIVVRLQDLPTRYSCDDLWYKFRDMLLLLGARPNMQILAYRCEGVLGVIGRSPSIHLQFEMPRVVQGSDVRWADMQASPRTVRLEPGHPGSLDSSDCELLSQIKATLLSALSDHIVAYHLACQAPPQSHPGFSVSVQALIPAQASDTRVASRSDQVPKVSEASSSAAAAHVH